MSDAGADGLAARRQAERLRDVVVRLKVLLRCIEKHAPALEDAKTLEGRVQAVANELAEPTPDETAIRDLLGGIETGAGSVGPVVDAIEAASDAIAQYLRGVTATS